MESKIYITVDRGIYMGSFYVKIFNICNVYNVCKSDVRNIKNELAICLFKSRLFIHSFRRNLHVEKSRMSQQYSVCIIVKMLDNLSILHK